MTRPTAAPERSFGGATLRSFAPARMSANLSSVILGMVLFRIALFVLAYFKYKTPNFGSVALPTFLLQPVSWVQALLQPVPSLQAVVAAQDPFLCLCLCLWPQASAAQVPELGLGLARPAAEAPVVELPGA